jgi:methionyl-tRNA synthetase
MYVWSEAVIGYVSANIENAQLQGHPNGLSGLVGAIVWHGSCYEQ